MLAAPAPPEQLVVAARATLDDSELQDHRGSKRDASARTPPPKPSLRHPVLADQLQPPPPGKKKSRGGAACNAALAAAHAAADAPAQLYTATTYAAAALAASDPHPNSNLNDPNSTSQLRLPPAAVEKSRGGAPSLCC